jgi:hypothetical protein
MWPKRFGERQIVATGLLTALVQAPPTLPFKGSLSEKIGWTPSFMLYFSVCSINLSWIGTKTHEYRGA